MSLAPGIRLGAYDIVALLGAGGMGEVYRAHDSRLKRDVAIKVLPLEYSRNPDRVRRFEQEARAAAALNHPNILTVFDIGAHENTQYIVEELIDGETLRARLERGPLPWRQAVDIAAAIADGLAAAHSKGIFHRDIKPANVILTDDGRIKLLDFGVAKLKEDMESGVPDGTATDTASGTLVGTTAYMSPEQVAARPVDARTDLFSLGTVLYEMVDGRNPFARSTTPEMMAAILKDEPPALLAAPTALWRVLAQCLHKNPEARVQSARDLGLILRTLADVAVGDVPAAAVPTKPRQLGRWLSFAAIAAVAIAIVMVSSRMTFRAALPGVVRSSLLPPANARYFFNIAGSMALSPDGQHIAFAASVDGAESSLWVRPLSGAARRLPGTENARHPFWSPDSRSLGFFADGLKVVDLTAGVPRDLCDAATSREVSGRNGLGGTWNATGVIVFNAHSTSSLYSVPASGGPCIPVTTLEASAGDAGHRFPSFLPDGDQFLYHSVRAKPGSTGIYLGSLGSPLSTFILESNHHAVYDPSGYLLFVRQTALLAAPFDVRGRRLTGEATVLTDQLLFGGSSEAFFSASKTGTLSFVEGSTDDSRLEWIDRTGKTLSELPWQGISSPRLSNDGSRLAVEQRNSETNNTDIWVYALDRPVGTRLTTNPARDFPPRWSPDDQSIVFASNRKGSSSDIYRIDSRGLGTEELLFSSPTNDDVTSWSSDGRLLIFNSSDGHGGQELWGLTLPQQTATRLFTNQQAYGGEISPDRRWIAFESGETGSAEVWIRGFPPSIEKHRISTNGGRGARWRADSRELFYVEPSTRKIMSVSVLAQQPLAVTTPVPLFERQASIPTPSYDVTADGQRFLVRRNPNQEGRFPITLLQNWTELLGR